MNDDPILIGLVQIINETLGNELDKITALVLIYVLYNYDIYFSMNSPIGIDPGYPLEATQRYTCGIIAEVMGDTDEYGYNRWWHSYSHTFNNFYALPPEYQALGSEIIKKLSKHPWIDRLVPTF